jgi:hypothetical protein
MPVHACVDIAVPLHLQLKFTHLVNRLQNKAQSNRNKENELYWCSNKRAIPTQKILKLPRLQKYLSLSHDRTQEE